MTETPEMKVEVISKENIKPSSPTPPHLTIFTLSLVDQILPPFYAPLLLFYSAASVEGHGATDQSRRLKQSLSQILTRFYPLAGRILDPNVPAVDCNDDGAQFLVARAKCPLSNVLDRPKCEELRHFSPTDLSKSATGSSPLLIVQATFFDCGGLAVGISVSHQVADGAMLNAFVKAWSSAALGRPDAVVPDLTAASLFPPPRPSSINLVAPGATTRKYVPRRFVFDATKIVALRNIAACATVTRPTRVEAVSALLWKCAMAAAAGSRLGSDERPSMLTWTVARTKALGKAVGRYDNICPRISPPLSIYLPGNIVLPAVFHIAGGREREIYRILFPA